MLTHFVSKSGKSLFEGRDCLLTWAQGRPMETFGPTPNVRPANGPSKTIVVLTFRATNFKFMRF